MSKRKRITQEQIEKEQFYKLPKFLFTEKYSGLSSDAKILYALLRDRFTLSQSHGWVNEHDEVYLIFTRKEMEQMLRRDSKTVRKAFRELLKYELVEEEHQGLNRPNLIFLLDVDLTTNWSGEKAHSGGGNFPTPEGEILPPNKTDINKTDFNKTDNKEYISFSVHNNSMLLTQHVDPYIQFYGKRYEYYFQEPHPPVKNINWIEARLYEWMGELDLNDEMFDIMDTYLANRKKESALIHVFVSGEPGRSGPIKGIYQDLFL